MSESSALRRLREFIAIPSVNPMGRTDFAVAGERRYAQAVAADMAKLRMDCQTVGEGERLSVVGQVTAPGATETVLVASHLDTVPVDSMRIEPFDPVVQGDRVYGRGSCDTKGGMAAALAALERVLQRGSLGRNVVLVGEADEELGSLGLRDVMAHLGGRPIDFAVATEPTRLELVNSHKGVAVVRLRARGRACHSSNPSLGQNAIVALAKAVLAIEQLGLKLAEHPHPTLGAGTVSVGVIAGGQAHNIVPETAWLTFDRRTLPGETEQSLRNEVEAALAALPGVSVSELMLGKPALHVPLEQGATQACLRALAAAGLPETTGSVPFGTDAGLLSAANIPTLVFGPGSIAQAHTDDEYCSIAQLESATTFFERLFEERVG
jgi:acetylornithine deacetylase/succinyl-diaminopimelate desuccinylase-like protein